MNNCFWSEVGAITLLIAPNSRLGSARSSKSRRGGAGARLNHVRGKALLLRRRERASEPVHVYGLPFGLVGILC
jgi:hypothetical protein